jgi:hypothetical protein
MQCFFLPPAVGSLNLHSVLLLWTFRREPIYSPAAGCSQQISICMHRILLRHLLSVWVFLGMNMSVELQFWVQRCYKCPLSDFSFQ